MKVRQARYEEIEWMEADGLRYSEDFVICDSDKDTMRLAEEDANLIWMIDDCLDTVILVDDWRGACARLGIKIEYC